MASEDLKPSNLVDRLDGFISQAVKQFGGDTTPIKPGHRIAFHWPPHAVSHDYHVDASSFNERHEVEFRGETLVCFVARTPYGVFGRVDDRWNEARGETVEQVLEALKIGVSPWFDRMDAITACLGRSERYHGFLTDLPSDDLVVLLYCPDRDVAQHALVEIEKRASTGIFTEALIRILNDDQHPHRRIAQWCALDIFEDISAFARTEADQIKVIRAIRDLIWRAEDDYARTIFKAGVVLGGHICSHAAADALLECLRAPSKVGRRSAIHACFHLAEWLPSRRNDIVMRLNACSRTDEDPLLRDFAACIAHDIASGASEHVDEPTFTEEAS